MGKHDSRRKLILPTEEEPTTNAEISLTDDSQIANKKNVGDLKS
jgi:hypothetical protein